MGNRAFSSFFFGLLLLSGCATPSVKAVHFGDTEARMRSALGKPYEIGKDELGRVTWTYLGLIEGDCVFTLWDGKLVRAPRCPEDVGFLTLELKERRNQDYRNRVWGGSIEESAAKQSTAAAVTGTAPSAKESDSSLVSIAAMSSGASAAAASAASASASMAAAAAASSAASAASAASTMMAPPPAH